MTTTENDWQTTELRIMERWLKACENDDRHSQIFREIDISERLKRLLAVAYCYDIWPLIKNKISQNAVLVAEKYADSKTTKEELRTAYANAANAAYAAYAAANAANAANADDAAYAAYTAYAYTAAAYTADDAAYADDAAAYTAANAAVADDAADDAKKEKWVIHGKLLVSVIGPGWLFDVQWRTSTAVTIAEQMYESRDFSAMPILADAIQDAGCEEETLLQQMRSAESKWCRGSRIVDELLGKR